jgi:hypothetical protein
MLDKLLQLVLSPRKLNRISGIQFPESSRTGMTVILLQMSLFTTATPPRFHEPYATARAAVLRVS